MLTEQQQVAIDALFEASKKREEAFSGFLYKDKTTIPRLAQPKTVTIKARQVWKPKFIVGYKSDKFRYLLEIWYYPWKGDYRLYDKFGKMVRNGRKANEEDGYENLNDAIDDLMYIIGTKEPKRDARALDIDDQDEIVHDFIEHEEVILDDEFILQLLNENNVSREFVKDMVGEDVAEYNVTRMNKHRIRKFWKIFGKDVRLPSDYIPSKFNVKQQFLKLSNQNKEASFVVGYSLKGRVDVEIWYVKDTTAHDGGFAVFDLTSGQILAEGLSTLRWALFAVAKKLGVSGTRFVEDEEDEHNDKEQAAKRK